MSARVAPPNDERPAGGCPVCGEHDLRLRYCKWGYPIHRCSGCGLGMALTDEDTSGLYDASYFDGRRSDGYSDYPGSEPVLRREFRRVLARLLVHRKPGGRLLEVGCAYGYFLSEASSTFDCVGIEVSEAAAEAGRSRGVEIITGEITPERLHAIGPIDVVVMLDVIEHLPDPAATLTLLGQALVPDGTVLITTGDWGSLLARAMGKHWRLMTPPQHLSYFTTTSLQALLRRTGFAVIEQRRPWKLVPLGLALYQLTRRLGLPLPQHSRLNRLGLPINLFDTLQVIAVRR